MDKKEFAGYLAVIFIAGNPLVWILLLFLSTAGTATDRRHLVR